MKGKTSSTLIFNTFAMIPVTAVLIFMQQGSIQIATKFGLNKSASDIITGIILFFLIVP